MNQRPESAAIEKASRSFLGQIEYREWQGAPSNDTIRRILFDDEKARFDFSIPIVKFAMGIRSTTSKGVTRMERFTKKDYASSRLFFSTVRFLLTE